MAAPQVAGAAALLRERHPDWTVDQIKSALVTTGRPVRDESGREALPTREGGGLVDVVTADSPRLFAKPQGLSFGLLDVSGGRREQTATVALTDAGGGSGAWSVTAAMRTPTDGARVIVPAPSERHRCRGTVGPPINRSAAPPRSLLDAHTESKVDAAS